MPDPTNAATASSPPEHGFLAPRGGAEPVDHCFRCRKETPAGQALCDEHNPRRLPGPSATQMHATIFGGVVLGVLLFFVVARLAVGTTGPYGTEVIASSGGPDGTAVVSFAVTNEGDSDGVADCRVTRDGVPRPEDLSFRTERLPAETTVTFERQLAAPPAGTVAYDPPTITIVCS